jgi:hypothetical protein
MPQGSFRGRPPAMSVRKPCEKCKKQKVMAGKTMCKNCLKSQSGVSTVRQDAGARGQRSRSVGR